MGKHCPLAANPASWIFVVVVVVVAAAVVLGLVIVLGLVVVVVGGGKVAGVYLKLPSKKNVAVKTCGIALNGHLHMYICMIIFHHCSLLGLPTSPSPAKAEVAIEVMDEEQWARDYVEETQSCLPWHKGLVRDTLLISKKR